MDALTHNLVCEFHADERIYDACFLHDWDMFASAQSKYLHIYDSQGTELHCLRSIRSPRQLQFLPYHYLLVSCGQSGHVTWLDVSTGVTVSTRNTHAGEATCFIQNPHNAIVFHGSSRGRISMWSPNESEALVTMFCHQGSVLGASVDLEGKYLVTSGSDRHVKVGKGRAIVRRSGTCAPTRRCTTTRCRCRCVRWPSRRPICWRWASAPGCRCGTACSTGRWRSRT